MPDDYRMPTHREPPHNFEAEQALLGAVLVNNGAYERVGETLRPEHFADPVHGRIYDTIARTIDGGKTASPVTLKGAFEGDAALEHVGGAKYLVRLAASVVTVINAGDYAREIRDCYMRRRLIEVGEDIINGAHDRATVESAAAIIETAESDLFGLVERDASGGLSAVGSDVDDAMAHIDAAAKNGGKLLGLSTGLNALDNGTGGLLEPDLIVLAARPSMGKAGTLDSKVLLRDGTWKRNGDLRLGDELASVDGAPSRVSGIFPQGTRQVYRVTLGDGRSTRVCGEHLWAIESCKFEGRRVVSTDKLQEMIGRARYHRRIALPLVSGHFGEDKALPIDPWLLGAMLGNACLTGHQVQFSTADAATLFRVQQVVGASRVMARGDTGYDYRFNRGDGECMAGALADLGLMGKGSAEKFIPAAYLSASRQSRLELLRGLLDTDGWVETFGAIRYATASARLADDIQALVRSLGGVCGRSVKAPTFTYKGEVKDGLPSYVLNIQHPDRSSLVTLTRKKRRCREGARFRAPTVVSIEPDGVEPVQCIAVSHPDHLYVTDDYIVTHNTSLARQIAYSVARNSGPVAFFSLEMSRKQQNLSLLAALSRLPVSDVLHGNVGDGWPLLQQAAAGMKSVPLHIDDRAGLRVSQIRSACRRMKRKHGLSLVVIDYLQLMQAEGKVESQNLAVAQISGGLKALAKELSVPVLVLSQLNRSLEQRDDKRPTLSDLRDSGAIEQDADMVWFLYRDEYYLRKEEPRSNAKNYAEKMADWRAKIDPVRGKAELDVAKRRMGPLSRVDLKFFGQITAFGEP